MITNYQDYCNQKIINEVINWNDNKLESLNEALLTTALTTAMSIPQILKLFGKLINWISKKFSGKNTKVGDFLEKLGNKLHHAILKGLSRLIKMIVKLIGIKVSDEHINNTAHILFWVTIAFLAGQGLESIIDKISEYGLGGITDKGLKILTTCVKKAELILPSIALILLTLNDKRWRVKGGVNLIKVYNKVEEGNQQSEKLKKVKGNNRYAKLYNYAKFEIDTFLGIPH